VTVEGNRITVRPVTPDDAKPISAATARAFADDPLYNWVLPDASTRVAKETALNEALLPRMFGIDFVEMYTTPGQEGVAIWLGPEKWDPPMRVMVGALPNMLRILGLGGAMKMMRAMSALLKQHPKDQPHWYLMGLATDPPHQGKGVGGALVNHVLARCDKERLGAYLETQKPKNVPYYEKFGFRTTKEIDIPGDGPHIWCMWRDPM